MSDNTFTRMDLSEFGGITDGPWDVGRPNAGPVSGTIPVHTPGYDNDGYRDGALVCSVYGTATRSAANSRAIASVPRFIAALRAAYAEMDRLTADVEYWKQQQIEACAEGNGLAIQCEQLEAERDRLRASALKWVTVTDDPATLPPVDEIVVIRLFAGGTYMGVLDDFSLLRWQVRGPYLTSFQVGVGDRWAYIPEVQ